MSMHASRRTIVRGMVWGAPAIAVVAAAPAYAASGAAYSVSASRTTGSPSQRNRLRLVITSSPTGQSISGISVSYDGTSRPGSPSSGTTSHTWTSTNTVPDNRSGTVTFIAGGSTITLNFSI
ncbi:hypothetical protein GCM10027425_31430 [Alteromonas gracilis]